ncbi:unnamed protein product [Brachionus calyciflorus]|uniref:Apple domain-containing protein n=1 Tax=Brachionus calyciflorus TaxID=104777 RepID=A0A814M6M0_9BILA|nr:unnamed protein product [Brachionus calyciflorus]
MNLLILVFFGSIQSKPISFDTFIKNFNYDFLIDPRVILKTYSLAKTKCLLECMLDTECFFITFKNQRCQLYNKFAIIKKIESNSSVYYSKRSNYYRLGENLNDFFTTTTPSTTTTTTLPPVIISSVNNPYGVNWGVWGPAEECDQNDYVIGFRTKLHPKQSSGIDDTALNGVELICSNGKILKSLEGHFGSWNLSFRNCSNGQKVTSFSYGMEEKGSNDDSATNIIQLICSDGSVIK